MENYFLDKLTLASFVNKYYKDKGETISTIKLKNLLYFLYYSYENLYKNMPKDFKSFLPQELFLQDFIIVPNGVEDEYLNTVELNKIKFLINGSKKEL